jgi:hypothetical protein
MFDLRLLFSAEEWVPTLPPEPDRDEEEEPPEFECVLPLDELAELLLELLELDE